MAIRASTALRVLRRLFSLILLILVITGGAGAARAQDADDAAGLLRKAESLASATKNWRAEVVRGSELSGREMNMKDEVYIKFAAQAPLKMRRENSGGDQTVLVCDGVDFFYSGDRHSYYRGPAKGNPDCISPLRSFYRLRNNPASVSIVGHDHVLLADGDYACEVVRAEWKSPAIHIVRTMCIDPTSGLMLRDVTESANADMRTVVTTTFTSSARRQRGQASHLGNQVLTSTHQFSPRFIVGREGQVIDRHVIRGWFIQKSSNLLPARP